jgi:hypothetical protein
MYTDIELFAGLPTISSLNVSSVMTCCIEKIVDTLKKQFFEGSQNKN